MGYSEIRKQLEQEKKVKELTAAFHKFEKTGDEVFGRLLSVSTVAPSGGGPEYNAYIFDTEDGPVKFSVGTQTDKEWSGQVVVGCLYLVTFKEKIPLKGGRSVNKFSLKYYPERGMNEEPDENDPDAV